VPLEQAKQIKKLVRLNINWDLLIKVSLMHRVMPLLYTNLKKTCPNNVPASVMKNLRVYYFTNTSHNLIFSSALIKILNLFKEKNITAVPFKGPALAESAYGDVALRQFADLDVLVFKDDAYDAHKILINNNYKPELHLDKNQFKKYTNSEDNLTYTRSDIKIIVELHWEMTGVCTFAPLLLNHFNNRLISVTLLEKIVPSIPPEELLIYLCIHGAKDRWSSLDHITCVAELIRSCPGMNWELVVSLAERFHYKRVLFLGLLLAKSLLNTKVPDKIQDKIEKEACVNKIAVNIKETLFTINNCTAGAGLNARFSFFHLKVRDNFFDAIRYCSCLAFLPTKSDWRSFNPPARLSFLLYVFRPVRLVAEFFQRYLRQRKMLN